MYRVWEEEDGAVSRSDDCACGARWSKSFLKKFSKILDKREKRVYNNSERW